MKSVGLALTTATGLVGLLQLGLSFAISQRLYANPENISGQIGYVIGSVAIWPLIVLGLFSIGRRFRTTRNRTIILLCVWGLSGLANLANLGSSPTSSRPAVAIADDDDESPPVTGTKPVPQFSAEAAPLLTPLKLSPVTRKRFDFSPGSHERLIKEIEHAQESAYHEVVEAYARECQDSPTDVTLALERLEFVSHFAGAEDMTIESAEADYESARANLVKCFPNAPGTILFELERAYGPKFTALADRYNAQTKSWSRTDLARFALLRAQRLPNNDAAARLPLAEASFENEPTAEAAIIYAQALHAKNRDREAARVLEHDVFATAPEWTRKQQLDLLFDVGKKESAVALFKELEKGRSQILNTTEMAGRLAEAGELELARTVLARVPRNQWSRERVSEQRFQFELKYGAASQAEKAYRELRANGYQSDPFLRHRVELLLKYPAAGWAWGDLAGALSLGILLAVAGVAPLMVLLPVHYWSLLRQRRSIMATWLTSSWSLRSAWLVVGSSLVAVVFSLWAFQPKLLTQKFSEKPDASMAAPTGEAVFSSQLVLWTVTSLVTAGLIWRAKAWRSLGPGDWVLWKALGVGAGTAWGLRLALVAYIKATGIESPTTVTVISPLTTGLMFTTLKTLGPVGLIAVTGLFVPVLEEIMFRGVVLGALARHIPFWAANGLQAIGFALMHEELKLAPFFIGFALLNGFLVQQSRGLLAAISMHACNNTLACLGILLLKAKSG